jgi:hypothetical protein
MRDSDGVRVTDPRWGSTRALACSDWRPRQSHGNVESSVALEYFVRSQTDPRGRVCSPQINPRASAPTPDERVSDPQQLRHAGSAQMILQPSHARKCCGSLSRAPFAGLRFSPTFIAPRRFGFARSETVSPVPASWRKWAKDELNVRRKGGKGKVECEAVAARDDHDAQMDRRASGNGQLDQRIEPPHDGGRCE